MYILSTIKCLWIHQIRKKENWRWHRGQRRPTFALPYFGWSRSNTRFSDTFQTLFEVKRTKDTAFNFLSVTVWGTEKIRKKKKNSESQKKKSSGRLFVWSAANIKQTYFYFWPYYSSCKNLSLEFQFYYFHIFLQRIHSADILCDGI